jgi:hydrogenase maturation protein HypF
MSEEPLFFDLPFEAPPVLAAGAFLKNSVAAAKGRQACVSAPQGNLDTPEAILQFETALAAMQDWLGQPALRIAHDLHPDFPNSRYAQTLGPAPLAVQHHHAHVAAVAAEHGVTEPLLGFALDGFGLGPGNQAWGGELLKLDGATFERLGHLRPLAQPGGDAAAREPWRMAAALLHALGRGGEIPTRFQAYPAAPMVAQMLTKGVNSPLTTSAGRLFDAACGLLNVRPVAEFEGQAPMELEALADSPEIMANGWTLEGGVLDLFALLERLAQIDDPVDGARLFHGTLSAALADQAVQAAGATGIGVVALSGGCFLNRVLTRELEGHLAAKGIRTLKPIRLSPGDAGLSLGQAWIAGLTKN